MGPSNQEFIHDPRSGKTPELLRVTAPVLQKPAAGGIQLSETAATDNHEYAEHDCTCDSPQAELSIAKEVQLTLARPSSSGVFSDPCKTTSSLGAVGERTGCSAAVEGLGLPGAYTAPCWPASGRESHSLEALLGLRTQLQSPAVGTERNCMGIRPSGQSHQGAAAHTAVVHSPARHCIPPISPPFTRAGCPWDSVRWSTSESGPLAPEGGSHYGNGEPTIAVDTADLAATWPSLKQQQPRSGGSNRVSLEVLQRSDSCSSIVFVTAPSGVDCDSGSAACGECRVLNDGNQKPAAMDQTTPSVSASEETNHSKCRESSAQWSSRTGCVSCSSEPTAILTDFNAAPADATHPVCSASGGESVSQCNAIGGGSALALSTQHTTMTTKIQPLVSSPGQAAAAELAERRGGDAGVVGDERMASTASVTCPCRQKGLLNADDAICKKCPDLGSESVDCDKCSMAGSDDLTHYEGQASSGVSGKSGMPAVERAWSRFHFMLPQSWIG